jgi:AraC-like DNA-binding protein
MMDVLSDILRGGSKPVILSRHEYRGAWGVQLDGGATAGLHFVESGECWLRVGRDPAVKLLQGDVALLPRGAKHTIADAPRRRAQPLDQFLAAAPTHDVPVNARIVCAAQKLGSDLRGLHPLLREMPELIHIRAEIIQCCPSLSPCLRLLLAELRDESPGRSAVVELLLEAFLVYVVRHWVENEAPDSGWVGAMRDKRLARSLAAMHEQPEASWSVTSLARVATMSRPAFARRFRDTLGDTPLGYLTRLRMARGAELLRTTDDTLAQIAERVGYTSEFAFSRAFKRAVGEAPAFYRAGAAQPA